MSKAQTADGYIRVSRRAGREGESFISPEVQRKKIADWAKLHDVEIVRWWEEIDQSGAKLERPMFQQALARCEAGETGGIVVARLDRFARSAVDALTSIRRLNEAGARLVSVEDNFDGSTPMGRLAIGILILIAELELERIKGGWMTAVSDAVGRGVHISAKPPTGYKREKDGRLIRDEPATSFVADTFRRRATGASWAELARFLEENEIYPPSGNKYWSKVGVAGMIKNPVYLGQAPSGKVVKEAAHEPLVTRAEFDAAQAVKKSVFKQHDGSLASQAMLGGLPLWRLRARSRSRATPTARAASATPSTTASVATPRVPALLARMHAPHCLTPTSRSESSWKRSNKRMGCSPKQWRPRRRSRKQCETSPRPSTSSTCSTTRSCSRSSASRGFSRGLRSPAALDEARAQSSLAEELGDGDLLRAWPTLTTHERRRLMYGLLERVVVSRADRRGRHARPIGERAQIILRGGVELEPSEAVD